MSKLKRWINKFIVGYEEYKKNEKIKGIINVIIKESKMYGWDITFEDDIYKAKFSCNICKEYKQQQIEFVILDGIYKGVDLPIYCDECLKEDT